MEMHLVFSSASCYYHHYAVNGFILLFSQELHSPTRAVWCSSERKRRIPTLLYSFSLNIFFYSSVIQVTILCNPLNSVSCEHERVVNFGPWRSSLLVRGWRAEAEVHFLGLFLKWDSTKDLLHCTQRPSDCVFDGYIFRTLNYSYCPSTQTIFM